MYSRTKKIADAKSFSLEHRWFIRGAQVQRIFSQEAWLLNKVTWQQANIHRYQSWYLSQVLLLSAQSQGELEENSLTLCPWCQRGRNERHIAINAKGGDCWRYGYNKRLTQMVKVVIDGNRLVMEHAQEMLEHRSWNTIADAGTHNRRCWYTDAETQKLNHRCWNTYDGTKMLEHEWHRCWNTYAGTQMLEHEWHRCWNMNDTDAGTRIL